MSQVDDMAVRSAVHLNTCLQWQQVEKFLADLKTRCSSSETISIYRHNLKHFFQFLSEDGYLDRDTVSHWCDYLLASGYKLNTVNVRLSAVNSFLRYLDLREYQNFEHIKNQEDDIQPTLSRDEYLRLLLAARAAGDERVYLMIKVFATTGLSVSNMNRLTVQSVYDQAVKVDEARVLKIPSVVASELERFVRRKEIQSGSLFVDFDGNALGRSVITRYIQIIAEGAGLEPEKCTPRCLRKLYHTTQEELQLEVKRLVEQMYERLLEEERSLISWCEKNLEWKE